MTCFAVAAQKHPYAFFSLPTRTGPHAQDMIGRKIGMQATGTDPACRAAAQERHCRGPG